MEALALKTTFVTFELYEGAKRLKYIGVKVPVKWKLERLCVL